MDGDQQTRDWRRLFNSPTEANALRYARKWHPNMKFNPDAALAGVHKARLELGIPGKTHPTGVKPTDEQIAQSTKWLTDHGFELTRGEL